MSAPSSPSAGKVRVDAAGIVFHTMPAIVLSLCRAATAAAVLFAAYQVIDFITGEDASEVRGDIVEFFVGLLIGAAASRLLGLS